MYYYNVYIFLFIRRSYTETVGSPYWMAPECLRGREYCEQVESETGTERQRAGDRDRDRDKETESWRQRQRDREKE